MNALADLSSAERFAEKPREVRAEILNGFSKEQIAALKWDWKFWGRPKQQSPWFLDVRQEGGHGFFLWVLMAGRGFGKTRTAVENIARMLRGPSPLIAAPGAPRLISLIADTPFDMRQYTIEGPSGFLNVGPEDWRPTHHKSLKVMDWPNGCRALLFSAEDPETLRGASGDFFWWDELCKARYAQSGWNNLMFGLREGNPRGLVSTTPRPIPLLKELITRPSTYLTVGSTHENKSNLSSVYYREVIAPVEGTRLGRQEVNAEILDDSPDSLWKREELDQYRVKVDQETGDLIGYQEYEGGSLIPMPALRRIVVAVDPQGKKTASEKGKEADLDEAAVRKRRETGIVVAGLGEDHRGYILHDGTIDGRPKEWAHRAAQLYDRYEADCIIAETNYGGEMVEDNIRTLRPDIPVRVITASRGKWVRAEPVANLYHQGLVSHVGTHALLEDEMVLFEPDGMPDGTSPNRLDAMVWAMTELAVKTGGSVFNVPETEFVVDPLDLPSTWARVAAVVIDAGRVGVVWAAINRVDNVTYIVGEYASPLKQLAIHAEAIRARGNWIPTLFQMLDGAQKDESIRVAHLLADMNVEAFTVPLDEGSGIEAVGSQIAMDRFKVFHPMPHWLAEFRNYRWSTEGDVVDDQPNLLMRATAMIALHGAQLAVSEGEVNTLDHVEEEIFADERGPTGY